MMILTFLAGIFAVGAVMTAIGLHNAPDGYEDETGFHYELWHNNAPEIPNVACIWVCSPAHGAA